MVSSDLTEARRRAFRSWIESYFHVELPLSLEDFLRRPLGRRR